MAKKKAEKKTESTGIGYAKWLWLLVLAGLVIGMAVFVFIAKTQLPETSELENPEMALATKILSDDGREIGKAFRLNREWMTYEDLNPYIIDALVSTEDERFFEHSGIDARSTMRAFMFLGRKGGASTITQQLAKQFFTKRSRNLPRRLWQKMKEWTIAIQFEKRYTKGEIIAMYLNKFDFRYSSNGIAAAAKTYFGKDQSKLDVEEAAVLIGMLKNPRIYNPKRNMENAVKRRNTVLYQMVRNEKLDQATFDELKQTPIDMSAFKREVHNDGVAPYFRASLVQDVKKILNDEKYRKPDGTKYNIYTDGLIIQTTIDLDMQRHAEAAAKEHMSQLQETYFNRWSNKNPWTYDATSAQKKLRQNDLNRQVRNSDRFKTMRATYMTDITQKISSDIDNVRLWDSDIFRLFNAEKSKDYIDNQIRKKTFSKSQAAVYRKILSSDLWPELKDKWLKLQSASKKAFNKKVKMKVFSYNAQGEKTVTMTPLDSIKYHNQQMQIGSVSVDPKTGYIKTWVGGIGNKYFQYDHVKSNRQVGSTFKPFIYSTAISELAMSPCTKVQDVQYVIPANDPNFDLNKAWKPANARGTFSGEYMTLKEGLRTSTNSISLYLMKEIGNTERIRLLTEKLGIPKRKVPNAPSICLGVPELNVLDIAGAYTAFADNGTYHKPLYIKSIMDKNGKVIYQGFQEKRDVINPSYNYVMVDMLRNAGALAKNKNGIVSDMGGKTGTTNDYRDGWFVGITPDLVTATWVGGDKEWIRFYKIEDGQGGVMARPFYTKFLKKLENDPRVKYDKNARFVVPDNLVVELDCSKHEAMQPKEEPKDINTEEELELDFDNQFDDSNR